MTRLQLVAAALCALVAAVVPWPHSWSTGTMSHDPSAASEPFPIAKTDEEWRAALTPMQFAVLRRGDTEYPGTSPLLHEHEPGVFRCAACGQALFRSAAKFESGSGWPSFYDAVEGAVGTRQDRTLGTLRTEVHCSRCGGHLGHLFPDGPGPTGQRYCINGAALTFEPGSPPPGA